MQKPVKSKRKRKPRNRQTMNPGEITTTTEINTEIKLEVKLETASIVKVETIKGQSNQALAAGEKLAISSLALDMSSPPQDAEKTRDEIKAEREAKKLAKQAKKNKTALNTSSSTAVTTTTNIPQKLPTVVAKNTSETPKNLQDDGEKSREQIKAEREAKKLAKQTAKSTKSVGGVLAVAEQLSQVEINETNMNDQISVATIDENAEENKKKPTLTKAERRAIQEAQRAAKVQAQTKAQKTTLAKVKTNATYTTPTSASKVANKSLATPAKSSPSNQATPSKRTTSISPVKPIRFNDGNVKLFSHLERSKTNVNLFVNNSQIHPSIARLGEQYAKRIIVGSNARCMAFLNAIKMVVQDFETPAKKEFNRSLEAFIANCVEYLQKCRTLAVSVINAHKSLKHVLMQLPKDEPESELKERLCTFIETYIENQIGKAAQAINSMMQKKINNGDVILTFGCSSLINYICEAAQDRKVDFRVVIVDSRPFCEGQELLRRLTAKEIPCSYVLINAISFVMPEVTKVLLGAHALLANGYVMARTGTAQVALVARSFNVPVLVCCETHKFSERFQTDAIVYNELGNPDDIVVDNKCCLSNWQAKHKMSPLNLNYDITPPELVTAVVTEVSVLPCTSVPVILRMKPDWLVYAS